MISESGLWRRSLLCLAYWVVIFTEEEASFGDYGRKEIQKVKKKARMAGCYGSQATKDSCKEKGDTAAEE